MLNVIVAMLAFCLTAGPTTRPEWRDGFDAIYGLAPDEVLKHIPPPFIEQRMDFYAASMPDQAAAMPAGPNVMTVVWTDSPQMQSCSFAGPDDGKEVLELLLQITQFPAHQIEVDPELASQQLFGDWTIRKGAEPVKLLSTFVELAGKATNQKITAKQEEVELDAIVAKGGVSRKAGQPMERLELPLNSIQLRRSMVGAGPASQLFQHLAGCTGYPVIDETDAARSGGFFEWGSKAPMNPPALDLERVAPEHLDALLAAIKQQTDLQFTVEPRKITRWRVVVEK